MSVGRKMVLSMNAVERRRIQNRDAQRRHRYKSSRRTETTASESKPGATRGRDLQFFNKQHISTKTGDTILPSQEALDVPVAASPSTESSNALTLSPGSITDEPTINGWTYIDYSLLSGQPSSIEASPSRSSSGLHADDLPGLIPSSDTYEYLMPPSNPHPDSPLVLNPVGYSPELACGAGIDSTLNSACSSTNPAQHQDILPQVQGYQTPLHMAAGSGHDQMVSMLLGSGAIVDDTDDKGNTPLHTAVARQKISVVRLLLQHLANPNAMNKDGCTPVHIAVQTGSVEALRSLVWHGGDVCKKAGLEDLYGSFHVLGLHEQ